MAERRVAIIAFLVAFIIAVLPFGVNAANTSDAKEPVSTDKECSLTLFYSNGRNLFSELPVRIYKIAEVSSDCRFTLTPSFESTKLILNGIRAANEWNVVRYTLETHIITSSVEPDYTAITDSEGKISLAGLSVGLYLAVADQTVTNESVYIFDSALAMLPGLNSEGFWEYNVDIVPKSAVVPPVEPDEETELRITKLWNNDNGKNTRPKSIEVEIFKNGESYLTARLSEETMWSFSWTAKDDGSDWRVSERSVPSDYAVTVEKRENTFVLTNTFISFDPEDPVTPPTGDTANIMFYIIIMIISGIALTVLGIAGMKKRDEK